MDNLEKLQSVAEDTVPASNNGVTWDGPDDPANPLNWTTRRKVAILSLVSIIGFSTPFSADVSAPAIAEILAEFDTDSQVLAGFIISIYVLGNAIGPIVFAPASEIWGRSIIFHTSNILFVAFTVGCALSKSLGMLLSLRFLAGCAGAASLVVGGGSIADMIPQEKRGQYFAIFAIGGQLAPIIGPIIGAFLTQKAGWRWTFWIVVAIHTTITAFTFLLLKETYAPTILKAKVKRLQIQTGNKYLQVIDYQDEPISRVFAKASLRPLKMFFFSPIVFSLALFQALIWGYRFLMYTTIPLVFQGYYHFSIGTSGLAYLGSGLGASIAIYVVTKISDKIVVAQATQSGTSARPEARLLPMIYGAPLGPIGLFWYGWSAQARVQWIIPILGTLFFGAGVVAASLPANLYMIDAFTQYAASGLAASTFLRSIAGGMIPLAGAPMFDALGVGWGASVLGFVALPMCVIPIVFVRYGEALRMKYPLSL